MDKKTIYTCKSCSKEKKVQKAFKKCKKHKNRTKKGVKNASQTFINAIWCIFQKNRIEVSPHLLTMSS